MRPRFLPTEKRLLRWAADQSVCSLRHVEFEEDERTDQVEPEDEDWTEEDIAEIEAEHARVEEALSLVDEATLREDIDLFVDLEAIVCWVMDSLEGEKGRVPDHVVGQIAVWYPDFFRDYIDYHEKHPNEKPEFVTALLCHHYGAFWDLRQKPWYRAVGFFGFRDVRHIRMHRYLADEKRPRVHPHPPFEQWYESALEYPLPEDPPSYHLKYSRRERARFLDRLEGSLCGPVVESYDLTVVFQKPFCASDSSRSSRRSVSGLAPLSEGPHSTESFPAETRLLTGNDSSTRDRIEQFLQAVWQKTSKRFAKADILRVSGYKDRKAFHHWQKGQKVSQSAASAFERVLCMAPERFITAAERQKGRQ